MEVIMNQNIRMELAVATIFLLLLNFWECSEIETVLVEVAVLVLITKHLLEIVGGSGKKPPTIIFIVPRNERFNIDHLNNVQNCWLSNQEGNMKISIQ